jgi:hypothetical protein
LCRQPFFLIDRMQKNIVVPLRSVAIVLAASD